MVFQVCFECIQYIIWIYDTFGLCSTVLYLKVSSIVVLLVQEFVFVVVVVFLLLLLLFFFLFFFVVVFWFFEAMSGTWIVKCYCWCSRLHTVLIKRFRSLRLFVDGESTVYSPFWDSLTEVASLFNPAIGSSQSDLRMFQDNLCVHSVIFLLCHPCIQSYLKSCW